MKSTIFPFAVITMKYFSLTILVLLVCLPGSGVAQSPTPENMGNIDPGWRNRLIRLVLDEGYESFKKEMEFIAKQHDKSLATSLVHQILIHDHVDFSLDDIQKIRGAAIAVCGTDSIQTEKLFYPLVRSLEIPGVHDVIDQYDDGELAVRLANLICARPSALSEETQATFNINRMSVLGLLKHLARPAVPILIKALKQAIENPDDYGHGEFALDGIAMKELDAIGEYANEAAPLLLSIARNSDSPQRDRIAAIAALTAIETEPADDAEKMIAFIANPNEDVKIKIAAAKFLTEHSEHAKDAIPSLIAAWETPYEQKSIFWCYTDFDGVTMSHWASLPLVALGKQAFPAFTHELENNKSNRIRLYALECISRLSDLTPEAKDEIIKATEDGDPLISKAAMQLLGKTQSPKAATILLREYGKTIRHLDEFTAEKHSQLEREENWDEISKYDHSQSYLRDLIIFLDGLDAMPEDASARLLSMSNVVDRKISDDFNEWMFRAYLQVAPLSESLPLVSHVLKTTHPEKWEYIRLVISIRELNKQGVSLAPYLREILKAESFPVPEEVSQIELISEVLDTYLAITSKKGQLSFFKDALHFPNPDVVCFTLFALEKDPPDDSELRSRLREIAADGKLMKRIAGDYNTPEEIRAGIIWALRGVPSGQLR